MWLSAARSPMSVPRGKRKTLAFLKNTVGGRSEGPSWCAVVDLFHIAAPQPIRHATHHWHADFGADFPHREWIGFMIDREEYASPRLDRPAVSLRGFSGHFCQRIDIYNKDVSIRGLEK